MIEAHKRCNHCGVMKPVSAFARRGDRRGQYRSQCRDCMNAIQRSREREKSGGREPYETARAREIARREIGFGEWCECEQVRLSTRDWVQACERVAHGASYDDAVRFDRS
jgi:hypothetical protein